MEMNIRKGYTLIEMLAAITVITVLMIMLAWPVQQIVRNIPLAKNRCLQYQNMQRAVRELRRDIQGADRISFGSEGDEYPRSIGITGQDGQIVYVLAEDSITRKTWNPNRGRTKNRTWNYPGGSVAVNARKEQGNIYAVEVTTGIKKDRYQETVSKLCNSEIIFVGIEKTDK